MLPRQPPIDLMQLLREHIRSNRLVKLRLLVPRAAAVNRRVRMIRDGRDDEPLDHLFKSAILSLRDQDITLPNRFWELALQLFDYTKKYEPMPQPDRADTPFRLLLEAFAGSVKMDSVEMFCWYRDPNAELIEPEEVDQCFVRSVGLFLELASAWIRRVEFGIPGINIRFEPPTSHFRERIRRFLVKDAVISAIQALVKEVRQQEIQPQAIRDLAAAAKVYSTWDAIGDLPGYPLRDGFVVVKMRFGWNDDDKVLQAGVLTGALRQFVHFLLRHLAADFGFRTPGPKAVDGVEHKDPVHVGINKKMESGRWVELKLFGFEVDWARSDVDAARVFVGEVENNGNAFQSLPIRFPPYRIVGKKIPSISSYSGFFN